MKVRAIACDWDQTLTNAKGEIGPDIIDSILKAESMGIPIIIATARAPRYICGVLEELNIKTSGPIISENGGVVIDQKTGKEIILADREKPEKAYSIIAEEVKNLERVYNAPPYQRTTDVTIVGYKEDIQKVQKIILEKTLDIDLTFSPYLKDFQVNTKPLVFRYLMFLKDPKVSKGTGLKFAINLLGLKGAEVAVVGDAENDVPMFEVAGFRIAVVNAAEKLKEKADLVTKEAYGKGGKEAIEYILKNLI